MKLSDLGILHGHDVVGISGIWVDGLPYKLADDGDTLIEVAAAGKAMRETEEEGAGVRYRSR